MRQNITLESRFGEVEQLISQHRLKEAQQLIALLLHDFPQSAAVGKFLKKVDRLLQKAIHDEVHAKIAELKPLWKEQRYRELLNNYKIFVEILPDDAGIQATFLKLNDLVEKSVTKETDEFVKNSIVVLKQLYREEKYRDLLKGCNEFFAFDRTNTTVLKIYNKALKKFVKIKMKSGLILLKSQKFTQALDYFSQLYRLTPENRKLKAIILKLQRRFDLLDIERRKNLIKKQYEAIEREIGDKRYDDAMRNLNQVLMIDSSHRKSRRLLKKLQRKVRRIIEREVSAQISQAYRVLNAEYKLNKEFYVKI